MARKGVIAFSNLLCIAVIIQKNAPADNAMVCKRVNPTMVSFQNFIMREIVVKHILSHMPEVPETIPLTPGLGIH